MGKGKVSPTSASAAQQHNWCRAALYVTKIGQTSADVGLENVARRLFLFWKHVAKGTGEEKYWRICHCLLLDLRGVENLEHERSVINW